MPCRSYESDWVHEPARASRNTVEVVALKSECDRLARIACRAMDALETLGQLDMIKDTESRHWYVKHKKADAARLVKEAAEKAKKDAAEKLRKEALAKLTPEELAAFGIKKGKS